AILYADVVTGSMQRAIDETDRRRARQVAFNAEHGIVPRGITKSVADIMEGAHAVPGSRSRNRNAKARKVAEPSAGYKARISKLTPQQLAAEIKRLEEAMFQAAKNLEFEEAARLRDEVAALKYETLAV